MKKSILIVSMIACMAMLGGCGDSSGVESLAEAGSSSESSAESEVSSENDSSSAEDVDLDLTEMDGTMIYSMVNDMATNPDTYLGKTVSLKGNFASSYDETTKTTYYFVVVGDTTACCTQGVEFIWDENEHTYPDDYPAENAEVQISGVYGQYDENGNTYYYVAADDLTVL
ncbi:MAG: hypothetical protein ACI4JB_05160 [Porcipelethomonas sp.]